MRFWFPDLSLVLALIGSVILATVVARVVGLLRVRSAAERAASPPVAGAGRPADAGRIKVAS